jgi:hypothetical protein
MWLLEELNRLALELLENAEAMQQYVEKTEDLTKGIDQIQKWLEGFCRTLGRVVGLLTHPESPLPLLVQQAGGISVIDDLGRLQVFLDDHRVVLTRLGVPAGAVDKAIDALKEAVSPGGEADLKKPQTFDADILGTLTEFKDLVCEIAHSTLLKGAAETRELLLGVISGVIGTALVVVDVTTAAAALPHGGLGFWVGFKLVKSVWSGVNKVRKAIGTIKDKWASIKQRAISAKGHGQLPKPGDGQKLRPKKP